MGYEGVGNNTVIHYSNNKLRWISLCKTNGYRSTDDWNKVNCKRCLNKKKVE